MRLLQPEYIATKFEVTPQYITKLLRLGKIKGQKVGKQWVIDENIVNDPMFWFDIRNDIPDKMCQKTLTNKPIALSFFSGAMGLDIGISKAGFDVRLCSEIEPNSRKTISINEPQVGLIGDILMYPADQIRKMANIPENLEIDLVCGGPPCQSFSTAGNRGSVKDNRGNLLLTFIDKIFDLQPKYAIIENVRGLLSAKIDDVDSKKRKSNNSTGSVINYIVDKLTKGGYGVSFNLYNSANYGAPQKRERVIIICSKDKKIAPYLEPTHSDSESFNLPKWRTFKEVVEDLNESAMNYIQFPQKRLKYYEFLTAGQYWKHLPVDLQKEALGTSYYLGGGKTGFLRRLAWDQPSPTLVTNPTMPATDLCHPEKNRPLSIEEYKRVQEFPDDWVIYGKLLEQYRQIGNAVPVSLGYAAGLHILKLLNNEPIINFDGFKYSRYNFTNQNSYNKNTSIEALSLNLL